MATKKDPTITSATADPAAGAGPAPAIDAADHSAASLEGTYKDNPDKPDPSSVAQVQEVPEDWPTGH